MTDKEAMKLALEALETECDIYREHDEDGAPEYILEAITALKERLAQEKALQALHSENERLGLYRDVYAEPDLIARLRDTASKGISVWGDLLLEAAKEIEILMAERECYASAMDRMLAQPEQEPVPTLEDLEQEIYQNTRNFVSRDVMEWMRKRYYTTPPQRKPLTDEQIYDMYNEPRSDAEMIAFARAIEAAHGIKENT
jgi:hypothetical protein